MLRCVHLTLNCEGVSRVLKSGEEAILSSRVCKKTLWKSSISGRLPNKLSIWSGRECIRGEATWNCGKVMDERKMAGNGAGEWRD